MACPLRAREGADGIVALATVFSGALGFWVGGVSLMPLRLDELPQLRTVSGSGLLGSRLDSRHHGLIVPPRRLNSLGALRTNKLERAGPVGQLLAAGRRAPSLIVEVLRLRAEPLLALIWAVEKKVSYMVLS